MGCELAFLSQIELEEDLWIDVDIGGGEVSASVPAGYYNTIFDFAAAVLVALQTIHVSFTCALSTIARGHIQIGWPGTWDLLWFSGTHAANNVGEILGFDISADDLAASIFTSDNRHQRGWYSPVGPIDDSYERPQSMGPRSFIAASSKVTRTSWARHRIRTIAFETVEAENFFASDAIALNYDYETWWMDAAEGWPFNIFSDLHLTPPNWVDEGKFSLEVEENADLLEGVPRLSPGAAFYSFRMRLRKQL